MACIPSSTALDKSRLMLSILLLSCSRVVAPIMVLVRNGRLFTKASAISFCF